MNLVDSCGWLEYFADSPYADVYAPAIEDTGTLIVPTICILEVGVTDRPNGAGDDRVNGARRTW